MLILMLRMHCSRFPARFMTMLTEKPTPTMIVPSGLLAVHKPIGWSSSGVVSKIRYILSNGAQVRLRRKIKMKVGHGGTLDPMAEGVLVLGIGEGTKLMAEYLAGDKGYIADVLLGSETDTLDKTGNVTETLDCSHVTREMILDHLPQFRGDIMQVPPMYSALNLNGKRLYELARKGVEVERKPRQVTVYSLELADATLPALRLQVVSSGGFYVRSLIADLARSMEGRGHMTALLRTKQGPFQLEHCVAERDWTFETLCARIPECSRLAGLDSKALKPAVANTTGEGVIRVDEEQSDSDDEDSTSPAPPTDRSG